MYACMHSPIDYTLAVAYFTVCHDTSSKVCARARVDKKKSKPYIVAMHVGVDRTLMRQNMVVRSWNQRLEGLKTRKQETVILHCFSDKFDESELE